MKIATIISYCTNDERFLDLCVEHARPFSSQLIITTSSHFFDGAPENREKLNRAYSNYQDCSFVEYAFDSEKPYGIYCPVKACDDDWIHYWHSTARYVGFHFLNEEIDHLLFLDVDEIVDTARFMEWLSFFQKEPFDAVRFYSYFYFRKASLRAKSFSLNALLVSRKALVNPEMILTVYERKGLFDAIAGKKCNYVLGLDDAPLVHHYSWVRSEEELQRKVKSWGHHYEKDWQALLKEEFSKEFAGRDSLYGLEYEEVKALHDPLQATALKSASKPSSPAVTYVDAELFSLWRVRALFDSVQ
jgi:hypothetical protein